MLKFMVVLYKLPALNEMEFRKYLREVHGPMAEKLPGLRKYTQNYPAKDATRKHPGWNAVVELYFDNWEAMEAAWRSPEGVAATADLVNFADLEHTTWSAVEERNVR
jgi:uncharacterized protein (TIGR02118 family)